MRRLPFLVHRWSAIALGVLVFAWFVSGIALAYYPWPLLTESERDGLLEPFRLTQADTVLLGFRESSLRAPGSRDAVVGGRLERRNGELVYELWGDEHGSVVPIALLDAHTGVPLTPLARDR